MEPEFRSDWQDAGVGIRRSLELAHLSLVAGGLPVGSVLMDGAGTIVAEGRNRAYDPPGGADRLQGSPLAHAELNALAGVETATDLAALTLWSSHRPCAMCAAACAFTGVGTVRYVAPDPSDPDDGSDPPKATHSWLIVANLLFLSAIRAHSGPDAPMIVRAHAREPETTGLLDTIEPAGLHGPTLRQSLDPIWGNIVRASADRRRRLS